jgi:hypothetical protein
MRSVQIYIEGERDSNNYIEIELFNDEKIDINLSIQNIQDISKVFTDFSQSFTVPASSINNSIFKHFYENAVDLDSTLIDQRLRRNAFIEIDRTPFRSGKIQLEKANLKDGQPESYTITFYGDLVTLKDLFGEDKLSDLDYTTYDHTYTGTEVYNRLITPNSTTNYDVRYPLISSERLWSYGDATSTDISITGGRIDYTELFPALKVARVFDVIADYYNVNFSGLFLTDKRFTNLFLWCKNQESFLLRTNLEKIDITGGDSGVFKYSSDEVQVSTDIQPNNTFTSSVSLNIFNTTSSSVTWFVEVYLNGVYQSRVSGTGDSSVNLISNVNGRVSAYIYADGVISLDTQYIYKTRKTEFTPGGQQSGYTVTNNSYTSVNNTINLTLTSSIGNRMPDMKVSDFFSGVLKQFNLTCYPKGVDTFEIEPLDYWYQKGAVTDITDFVDVATIDVAKVPLYKRISFEHEVSKSYPNVGFATVLKREYGDLEQGYSFDGGDFNVKLPFENLRFEKFSGDNITVGYALEEYPDYKPYVPKPILMYMYDRETCTGFKFYDGSTEQTITQYMPFGQDVLDNGINYSLNFCNETSTLLEAGVRLTSLKAIFPTSLITSLELNDRLIIRDKRYIINNIKTDLTTGEVDLELINDFRTISNENQIILGESNGLVEIPILVPNGVNDVEVTTATTGVTLGATTNFTSDGFVEVNYSANPTPSFFRIAENGDTRVTEYQETRRSEDGVDFIVELDLENTYINGDVTNTQIYLIQEA